MGQFFEPGQEVDGKYVIVRLLGYGGMGQVYEAEDCLLGRPVALKVLPERAQQEEVCRERLAREGRLAARIQHQNIVRVYEIGSDGETDYLAMELLRGEDLFAHIARHGALEAERARGLFLELADALIAMHAAGVVHRDLKPRNLFLERDGSEAIVLKVLDFGVARDLAPEHEPLAQPGQVLGTLDYMAPEQLRSARHADARSDIWSAGAIFYEVVAGRPAFEAASLAGLALAIASESPPPLAALRPELPAYLCEIIERCLSRSPAARFQSAGELRAALRARDAGATTGAPSRALVWADTNDEAGSVSGEARVSYSHAPPARSFGPGRAFAMGVLTASLAMSCVAWLLWPLDAGPTAASALRDMRQAQLLEPARASAPAADRTVDRVVAARPEARSPRSAGEPRPARPRRPKKPVQMRATPPQPAEPPRAEAAPAASLTQDPARSTPAEASVRGLDRSEF